MIPTFSERLFLQCPGTGCKKANQCEYHAKDSRNPMPPIDHLVMRRGTLYQCNDFYPKTTVRDGFNSVETKTKR